MAFNFLSGSGLWSTKAVKDPDEQIAGLSSYDINCLSSSLVDIRSFINNGVSSSFSGTAVTGTSAKFQTVSGALVQGSTGSFAGLSGAYAATTASGNATLNALHGRFVFASGTASVVVSCSLVAPVSTVLVNLSTDNVACSGVRSTVPAAGYFTTTLNKVPDADVTASFLVFG